MQDKVVHTLLVMNALDGLEGVSSRRNDGEDGALRLQSRKMHGERSYNLQRCEDTERSLWPLKDVFPPCRLVNQAMKGMRRTRIRRLRLHVQAARRTRWPSLEAKRTQLFAYVTLTRFSVRPILPGALCALSPRLLYKDPTISLENSCGELRQLSVANLMK